MSTGIFGGESANPGPSLFGQPPGGATTAQPSTGLFGPNGANAPGGASHIIQPALSFGPANGSNKDGAEAKSKPVINVGCL